MVPLPSDTTFPSTGYGKGKTVAGTAPDDGGEVQYEGPNDPDELLTIAGIRTMGEMMRRIRDRLPTEAELLDDGRLRAENNRQSGGYDYLNARRQFVLRRLDEGMAPLDIVEEYGFTDSYVYRARSVFGFLLEDPNLRKWFVEGDGEFGPDSEEVEKLEEEMNDVTEEQLVAEMGESEDEKTIPVEEARAMAENAYQNGVEEGREEAPDPEESSDEPLFNSDERWDIVKALIQQGEDEYARRIASEIDFD